MRIIEKLIRQQVDIHGMQFGFMPGCGTTNLHTLCLEIVTLEPFSKKSNLYFAYIDLDIFLIDCLGEVAQ